MGGAAAVTAVLWEDTPDPSVTVLPASPERADETPTDTPTDTTDAPPDLDLSELAVPVEAVEDVAPTPTPVATVTTDEPRGRRVRRAPDPEPPAPVDTRPGRVNVVTRGGWADVYLRGRLLGRTPRSVELPAGDHVLELRPFGQSPGREIRVHVEPGGVERVVEPVSQ